MDETPTPKKRGWPKGKKRGPKAAPMFTAAAEVPAPSHVIVRLKNGSEAEFGYARRTVENGFHVFFYPSEVDRYRETRREFAISEIVEIEITEARQHYIAPEIPGIQTFDPPPQPVLVSARPVIHSARQNAAKVLGALEQSSGPIKMDSMPNLSFGDSEG